MELVAVSFLAGLLCGSFANVVIARVPEGRSVVHPASACPACDTPIRPVDNIPVVSWVLLRGRCRACQTRITARYPLIELAMAAAFAGVAASVGVDWALPGYLLFAWTLLVCGVIDARTRRIPNRLTYPLTPALLALLTFAALAGGNPGAAARALLAGVVTFATLLGLALVSGGGMGMGDVKLGAFIGIGLGYLGWGHVVLGMFGAFLLGGTVALVLLGLRLRGRRDLLPFGPYLAVAAVVAVLAGGPVIDAYRRLTGL